jgi:beta-N-acetylhexosaminidase
MSTTGKALGPLMLDLAGTSVTSEEREVLRHPLVGGVILFARNYADPDQLAALCGEIHALRQPALLIAVDHEGGRVQRFREHFTALPAMACLGELWDRDPLGARAAARAVGRVLAAELRARGVDFSFTPVLDLDYGASSVIGDRAFHRDPAAVSALAGELIEAMADHGMAAVGKHFPGHGFVRADSHLDVPVDERSMAQIAERDLAPYRTLGAKLAGVMPAHVIYSQCDSLPAGFSAYWLRRVLRQELGFRGAVFTDDLSMEGARVAGDMAGRAEAARAAGCDMLLVCNDPAAARGILDHWRPPADPESAIRLERFAARPRRGPEGDAQASYRQAIELVGRIPRRAPAAG